MKSSISITAGETSSSSSATNSLVPVTASQYSFSSGISNMSLQTAMNLLDIEFPIFEEATQTAAHFLNIPICIIGIPNGKSLVLKAAAGLSQLGLMNPLARTRRLSLEDKLANHVLQQRQRLILPKVADREPFNQSFLVREYGIRAYLGVPLLTADGNCLGCLAAMDVAPHNFSANEVAFIELLARWTISEYERYILAQNLVEPASIVEAASETAATEKALLDTVRLTLMSQLTQDMRNPLTTITGMASILSREIYGSLTPKQREYAGIVHSSSQSLLEMANDVLDLSSLATSTQPLQATSVDLEMLGRHIQKNLSLIATENNQEIHFTVEPSSRLWTLDKTVVIHLLNHLTYSIVKLSGEGGTIRIHASEREQHLSIAVWHSHPWLGEGIPTAVRELSQSLSESGKEAEILSQILARVTGHAGPVQLKSNRNDAENSDVQDNMVLKTRETLSLLLSRHLVERHGGTLELQGTADSGQRFLITLPSA